MAFKTVQECFVRFGDMLIGGEHGPLPFRFVLQPLVAVVLAVRVGLRDAREGRPVFTDKTRRRELLRLAWKDVGRVFIVAFVLDVVCQLMVRHWVYPMEALLVAVVLAFIPYLLVRGPATRIARRFHQKRKDSMTSPVGTTPPAPAHGPKKT